VQKCFHPAENIDVSFFGGPDTVGRSAGTK
jgi:hypothetical protein